MNELERYHKREIERLTAGGDWSSLVRHFIGHGGYQPAIEAAISVLENRAENGGLEAIQDTTVVDLLKDWKNLENWKAFSELLQMLGNSNEQATLVLMYSFSNAALVEDLAGKMGDERIVSILPQLLGSVSQGIAIALKGNDLAVAAVLNDTAARGLSAIGRYEEALERAKEVVTAYRELVLRNRLAFHRDLMISLNSLAILTSAMGCHEEAQECAEEAVTASRELASKDRSVFLQDLAFSVNTLASILSELGHREEALHRAEEAVTAYRELVLRNRVAFLPDFALAVTTLGIVLSGLGRLEEALERAQESVTAYRELVGVNRVAFLANSAMALNVLANMLSELGRREEALGQAEEAVSAFRELVGRNRVAFLPLFGIAQNTLAIVLSELGRREEALELAEEAVGAYSELVANNRAAFLPNLAAFLGNSAAMLNALGRQREALERAERAVTAYRELARKNRAAFLPNLAGSLNTLALLLSESGRRGDALDPAAEAVTAYRELARRNPRAFLPYLAASLNTRALVLIELGRREEALERAKEAVIVYRELPDTIRRTFSGLGSKAYRTVARIRLIPKPSGVRELNRALGVLRQSIHCVEEYRGSFREDGQRRRVLAEAIASYELIVQTAVELWATQRDVIPLWDALRAAEGIRQRQLLERLRAEVLEPDAPEAVRKEWRRRFEELDAAENSLATFALNSLDGNLPSLETGLASPTADDPWSARRQVPGRFDIEAKRVNMERRRDEARGRHELALKAVHDTHPGFDPYQPVPVASHADAHRLLEAIPGTVLVEYVVCRSGGFALLVSGGQLHAVRLPEVSVEGALALLKLWTDGYPSSTSKPNERVACLIQWGRSMDATLLKLAPMVLWPVLRALEEFEERHQFHARRLVFCPHQCLNLLPIHAMPVESHGGELLVDRYEVSYAPSISVLKWCASRRPENGRKILFGNPSEDLQFIGAATEAYRRDHPEADVIHGRTASVDQLIQRGIRMGWGEIWAHMSASDDPMMSGILLADGEVLRLERIYRELRLRSKPHLTLNGCESGVLNPVRRRRPSGETAKVAVEDLADFDGLPMGFLFAGARSVMSTLWTVFDVSAALLMDRYHAELEMDGSTPASALRRASQWLRKEIRNGTELQEAGEALLRRVPEEWARTHADDLEDCRSMLDQMAAEHPDDPPFASPIHWASHFVTGWCWDPVDFTEKK